MDPRSRHANAPRWGAALSQTDPALRALFTGYLIVIGIGLLMSFAQILFTHGLADGRTDPPPSKRSLLSCELAALLGGLATTDMARIARSHAIRNPV